MVRLVATLLIRTVILTKKKGCRVWVLAAVWGTLYQLIITPIRWTDNTAEKMAKDVEIRMKNEAEEPFIYPRLQIVKAKEEAKPIYKMAQELFRRDQTPSGSSGPGSGPALRRKKKEIDRDFMNTATAQRSVLLYSF